MQDENPGGGNRIAEKRVRFSRAVELNSVSYIITSGGMKVKLVVKVDLRDHKDRSKAMRAVSRLARIGSLTMDMQDSKLTVSGEFDPVKVVRTLRNLGTQTSCVSDQLRKMMATKTRARRSKIKPPIS